MNVRQGELQRLEKLNSIRQPRFQHWQDITQYLVPYAGRYLASRDQNVSLYQDIIDETATHALEILESGMMSMRTSPARPWYRFQTADDKLNKRHAVREWFSEAQLAVQRVFHRSNTNLVLPQIYSECGAFGTAASILVEDNDTVIHHHLLTAGEYSIAADARGLVDTLYREFVMSAAQLVKEFGIENCSKTVQTLFKSGQLDATVCVVHIIEPRADRDHTKRDARNMAWKSCYFEKGGDDEKYLRESGYPKFPAIVPRWRVTGGDVWGEGPGTKALGSVRQLQVEQMEKARAIANQANPPLQVPVSLKDRDRDLLPGGISPYDQNTPQGGIRTAYEVPLRIDYMLADIEDVRRRINTSFSVPLFQTIASIDASTQRTALEIMQRKEETLTMLGPVTNRFQLEQDDVLLEFTVERLIATGKLSPPPPELQGMPLEIEQIGPLAQALKAVSAQANDRFVLQLGTVAQLKPDVLDKFDADAWVDIYSDMWGVDPSQIVAGKNVALIRDARAKAQAAEKQSMMMAEQAGAVKDLAGSNTGGDTNALTDIAALIGGVGTPAGSAA